MAGMGERAGLGRQRVADWAGLKSTTNPPGCISPPTSDLRSYCVLTSDTAVVRLYVGQFNI